MNTHEQSPVTAAVGDWVQVHNIVLTPTQRTGRIPEDTHKVPFESWVKGFLVDDRADLGDIVEVTTTCGRTLRGELVAVNPGYDYGFGEAAVPELLGIGRQARQILKEASHA